MSSSLRGNPARKNGENVMEVLKINPSKPNSSDLIKIVSCLTRGKIVVLPTETVYTFAADATSPKAITNVYNLKGRDFSKPLHAVVSSISMAKEYAIVTPKAEKLARIFLPGPLTLVLNKRKGILPDLLTANLPTLGIRIPDLAINLVVSKFFKKPYTTTSANLSGGPNPYSVSDVLSQLDYKNKTHVDLVVDVGPLPHLNPSTLIDLTQNPPKILREGPISKRAMEKIIGNVA